MQLGLVYMLKNKINGKKYIGQTIRELNVRIARHLMDSRSSNLPIHRALKKYGINNFDIIVLEKDIPKELLDEKEQYYIKNIDSVVTSNIGYNIAPGGRTSVGHAKITIDEVDKITQLLLKNDLTYAEIGKKFNVSMHCIYDINVGKSWFRENIKYPIKKIRHQTSSDEKQKVIEDILNCILSFEEISIKHSVDKSSLYKINSGRLWKDKSRTYPLRKIDTINNELIINDIVHSIMSFREIAKKHKVAYTTVSHLNNGKYYKNDQYEYPLRQNKYSSKL